MWGGFLIFREENSGSVIIQSNSKDKYVKRAITIILLFVLFWSCKNDDPITGNSDVSILKSFGFQTGYNNPQLAATVDGTINSDRTVTLQLPAETDLTKLVATFTFEGKEVIVNGVPQSSGVSQQNFSAPVTYTVVAGDGSKSSYVVTVNRKPNSGNKIKSFVLKMARNKGLPGDVVFDVDEQKGEITGTLLYWIDSETPSKLVASFETDAASVAVNGVSQINEVTVNDFREKVIYKAKSENTTEKSYTVRMICPQVNASLPVLRINSDAPVVSGEQYVKANLQILGNGITEGLWNSYLDGKKIEIRLRGNSTEALPKKPYRIKFPEKYSPLGLNHAKEKSWVLLANDADKTLLRNAVAFKAGRILNDNPAKKRFVPATLFVDLYMNGQYQGNYHFTDQVEVGSGRVDIESLKASDGDNPLKITGGYLLEIDGFGESEPLFFKTLHKNLTVTVKYPEDDNYDVSQFNYIKDYFGNQAEAALFAPDFSNPTTGWRRFFDETTLVDYYIISELTGNPDSWWSTYVFKHRNDPLLYFGPIWDFDIAFNNDQRLGDATYKLMAYNAFDPKVWIQQFLNDDGFKKAVKQRWNAKRSELKTLVDYVDQMVSQINLSQEANFKRWNIQIQSLGHGGTPPQNYAQGISTLKKYLNARYDYINTTFNGW